MKVKLSQKPSATAPPEQPAPARPREKSIFHRIAEIVIEDIKAKLGIDQKSREDKMKYDAFMEMVNQR